MGGQNGGPYQGICDAADSGSSLGRPQTAKRSKLDLPATPSTARVESEVSSQTNARVIVWTNKQTDKQTDRRTSIIIRDNIQYNSIYNDHITELAAKVIGVPQASVSKPTFDSLTSHQYLVSSAGMYRSSVRIHASRQSQWSVFFLYEVFLVYLEVRRNPAGWH